jgi:hypothetical protein
MRKVVDSNFLQNEELRAYLARSDGNQVVLTDYAAMEAYKGDTLVSIFKSMAIVSDYPRQVIVLKGTKTIGGLSGRSTGLQRRLIDEKQTQQFRNYCRMLKKAKQGDRKIQECLLNLGRDATTHMDRLIADATKMASNFETLAKTFTQADLRALRIGARPSDAMLDRVPKDIMRIAAFMFRDHPQVNRLPQWTEAPNTFIFRAALCMYLWALRWISVGGAKGAKAETVRNDMVDLLFAAYATFFDGLLTSDKKLATLYKDAKRLLRGTFLS